MDTKTNYDIFSEFYDEVMGVREKAHTIISELIKTENPKAKSILELAVGTGSNLVQFSSKYEISGLDLSEKMLQVARKKLPNAHLYEQDMVNFKLDSKFDVVLCIYDSINHILDFDDWKRIFKNVQRHLNEGGVFIFDVNTLEILKLKVSEGVFEKELNKAKMKLVVLDEGGGIFNWHIEFSENQDKGDLIVQEENIREVAFPVKTIVGTLEKVFSNIKVRNDIDPDTQITKRVYFCCKK